MKKLLYIYFCLVGLQSCKKSDDASLITQSQNNASSKNSSTNVSVGELIPDIKLDSRIINNIPLLESIQKGKLVYTNVQDSNGNTCMSCHISKDGYDIALFNNIDSIGLMNRTFHRALKHVSTIDAVNVMNYIKSLTHTGVTPRNSIKNVFQPGTELVNENQFANLIGLNNNSYNYDQINGWDFTQIKVPIKLPSWIDTSSINDVMPDKPMQLLRDSNTYVKSAYLQYLNDPSNENYVRFKRTVFDNLTEGQKHPGEHGYSNFMESYNTMKWMSSLYIQHVIRNRNGVFGNFNIIVDGQPSDNTFESVLDPLWFAGDIARRSLDNGSIAEQLPERDEIRSTWLYFGWIGNYGRNANFETKYIAEALLSKQFQYLAQAVILKSIINRPNNTQSIFDDLRSAGHNIDPNTGNFDKCLDFMTAYVLNKLIKEPTNLKVTGDDKKWSLEDLQTARGFVEQKAGNQKILLLKRLDDIIAAVNAM